MSPQPETSDASERPAAAPRRRTAGDRSMQRATVIAVAVGLVLDVIVLIVAATRPESTALAGALVGTGLTLVVVLPSMAIAFLGPRLSPMSMAATVLGSWAVKMFVVILILLLVRDLLAVHPVDRGGTAGGCGLGHDRRGHTADEDPTATGCGARAAPGEPPAQQ